MNDTSKIKRNIIIFTIFSAACGWIGYLVDKLSGQVHYENVGTMAGEEPFGMLIWLASPLILYNSSSYFWRRWLERLRIFY